MTKLMEKLETIINEMMADDGPVPMDLGNVGTHDTKMTQSDLDTGNDMSYEDVCAIAWKGYKASKGTGKKRPKGPEVWHRGKGGDEWTSGRTYGGKEGGKKGSKGSKLDWYGDKDKKEALDTEVRARARARAGAKPGTASIAESKGMSE